MDAIEVPDYAEPMQAWRAWRLILQNDGVCLGSVVYPTVWPPGHAMVAGCLRVSAFGGWFRRGRRRSPQVPAADCACGIYGAELPRVAQYMVETPGSAAGGRVLGRVSLWGTVIECERGFRASHAYPAHIYVPVDASKRRGVGSEELAAALEAYGVPVELLPSRCADAVRALEHDLAGLTG